MIESAPTGSSSGRAISMKQIVEATALVCGIPTNELMGRERSKPVVRARQIACTIARDLPSHGGGYRDGKQVNRRSLPAIGRYFGRDHTTVIHAITAIETNPTETPWRGLTVAAAMAEINRVLREPDRKLLWMNSRASERKPVTDTSYAGYVETRRRAGLPILP